MYTFYAVAGSGDIEQLTWKGPAALIYSMCSTTHLGPAGLKSLQCTGLRGAGFGPAEPSVRFVVLVMHLPVCISASCPLLH